MNVNDSSIFKTKLPVAWHWRKWNWQRNSKNVSIYQNSQATQPVLVPLPPHFLADILRNTTQFGKYRTVDPYAETAGVKSTHRADTVVAMFVRNGLKIKVVS